MSKKITYQVGLGLLSLVMVGAAAQADDTASEGSGMNFRVKAGAVSGNYDATWTGAFTEEDEVDFGGLELSAALLFNSGMFVEVKSTKLDADAADVDSDYPPVDVSDWSRDELAVNFGFAAGGGGIVIGYQDNTTVNESTPTEGDIELSSSGLTFAYGLVGMFGESDFGYSATLGFGFMDGNYSDDVGTDVDADYTLGYSLGAGLSWAPLEGLTLGADYKWQSYEFDFTGTSDVTIEEVISRFVFSASYTF